MSAAPQYEPRDPVAEARAKYRDELRGIVEELAGELGYTPRELVVAARLGTLEESPETAQLLVALRLIP